MNKNLQYSKEHEKFLHKQKKDKITILTFQIGLLVGFLGLWELLGQLNVINTFITSSPSRIFNTFITLLNSGDLWYHLGITLYETLIGFLIATVLGTIIAILLWWSEKLRKILTPYIVVLNSLPKIAQGRNGQKRI